MDVTLDQVERLTPATARALIPSWLAGFVDDDPETKRDLEVRTAAAMAEYSDEEVAKAVQALLAVGEHYQLYEADLVARAVTRACMRALVDEPVLEGAEHLRSAMERGPCLILANHLAYADTLIKDFLLTHGGATDLADVMIAVAGPKVYGTVFRRMAALGLSTLKTAQSTALAHNEASLSPREVGRIALNTVQTTRDLMAAGRPVLIYGEGSRSRNGRLQPFLKGVRKYAQVPGIQVVPMGISGSNHLMPLHQPYLYRRPVAVRIGPAVDRGEMSPLDAVVRCWERIPDLLDDEHRPEKGTSATV